MLRPLLIFLHLGSVIVWVGGMVFAYFCLRPAATRVLEPPQRLPLWAATFGIFFRFVGIAIAIIFLSGFAMLVQTGFGFAPLGWYIMLALGFAMAGVFGYIDRKLYPMLRHRCETADWPAAALALNSIRRLVAVNLVLAVCTIAAALSSR